MKRIKFSPTWGWTLNLGPYQACKLTSIGLTSQIIRSLLERQATLSFEPNSYQSASAFPSEHGSFGIGSHLHLSPSTSRISAHAELANGTVDIAANSARKPSSFQGAGEERSVMTKMQEGERQARILQDGSYYHTGFGTKYADKDVKPPFAGPNSVSAKLYPIIPAENLRPSNIRSQSSNNPANRPMTSGYSSMAGEPHHFPQSSNSSPRELRGSSE